MLVFVSNSIINKHTLYGMSQLFLELKHVFHLKDNTNIYICAYFSFSISSPSWGIPGLVTKTFCLLMTTLLSLYDLNSKEQKNRLTARAQGSHLFARSWGAAVAYYDVTSDVITIRSWIRMRNGSFRAEIPRIFLHIKFRK